jgi:hypothetical protein
VEPNRKRHAIEAPDDAWKRLGELLQLRRGELGYLKRPGFCEPRGINTRMVADIEHAYRHSFPPATLKQIARAYEVTYESITTLLRGEADELIAAEPAPPPSPPAMAEIPAALREARNLAARIEQLLAASGDPAAREALSGYVNRALRRVQIEVEELLEETAPVMLAR